MSAEKIFAGESANIEYKSEVPSKSENKGDKMILYHGAQNEIEFPIHPKGRLLSLGEIKYINSCRGRNKKEPLREGLRQGETIKRRSTDFGVGFYLTESYRFAALNACGHKNFTKGYLYKFELDLANLCRRTNKKIYNFTQPNIQWLLYIAYNRGILKEETSPILFDQIRNFDMKWDVITGPTANDRYYRVVRDFLSREPNDPEAAIRLPIVLSIMEKTNYPIQYTIKSEEICAGISLFSHIEIKGDLYDKIQKSADMRAKEGNREAGRILRESSVRAAEGYSFAGLLAATDEIGYDFEHLPDDIEYIPRYEEIGLERAASVAGDEEAPDDDKDILPEDLWEKE